MMGLGMFVFETYAVIDGLVSIKYGKLLFQRHDFIESIRLLL